MAVSTGKRKWQEENNDQEPGLRDEGAVRDLFQRAFEAKFKPLERLTPLIRELEPVETDNQDHEEDSHWDGLSEDEKPVEIVNQNGVNSAIPDIQRHEMKEFMSSKPPGSFERHGSTPKQQKEDSKEDSSEAANMKNDLALERLLKESHLLDPTTFKGAVTAPEGKGKFRAFDSRMKDLGAKASISQQKNMPLTHRKGITAKAIDREDKRHKDAADNGVILEKAKKTGQMAKRRERSVGKPAIGKFKGGTLKLNSRDVKSIEGSKQGGLRRGKGRR